MAEIRVGISADASKLNTELKRARASVEAFKAKAQSGGGIMGSLGTKMQGLGAAGVAGAVAAAVGASVVAIKSFADMGDEIGDTADRFKITTEEVQRFGLAAELSGTNAESLYKGLGKTRMAMADAAAGSKEAQAAMAAVGISLADIKSGSVSTSEAYRRIADAVSTAGSETDKLTMATRIFGDKLATELLPSLEKGGTELERLGNGAQIVSDESIAALSRMSDAIKEAWYGLKALGMEAVGTVANFVSPDVGDPRRRFMSEADIEKEDARKKESTAFNAEIAKRRAERDAEAKAAAANAKAEADMLASFEEDRAKKAQAAIKANAAVEERGRQYLFDKLSTEEKIARLTREEAKLRESITNSKGRDIMDVVTEKGRLLDVMEMLDRLRAEQDGKPQPEKKTMGKFSNQADQLQAVGLFAGGSAISYSRSMDENTRKTAENTARIARAVEGKQTTSPTVYAP